ncbi:MAG: dimethylargininase [Actinomycetales bacterium]
MTAVLVRRPGPRLAEGLITHICRSEVDLDAADRQWHAYVEALATHGWRTIEVPPAPSDCPDSVFIEDTAVVYADVAVIARSGAQQRRPETEAVEVALREAGYRIARIEAPGTLDGGDVLKHGGTVWVGLGGRTNAAGVAQLREVLSTRGAEVIGVPVTKALHLKSAVTALPDGTIVGWPPVVDDPGWWPGFRAVPEEPGAHVVLLDATTVLLAASAPRTRELLEGEGYRIVSVDISEFEKLEGCVTCLSIRLRG